MTMTNRSDTAGEERALIVAWMRAEAKYYLTAPLGASLERYAGATIGVFADAIERGEHSPTPDETP